jgi:peroxidase
LLICSLHAPGSHTFGKARCTSFQARLSQSSSEFPGSGSVLESRYLSKLQSLCPLNGDGNVTAHLDPYTAPDFDNQYFKNLQAAKGLLISDSVLHTTAGQTNQLVEIYANDERVFFKDFARSIVKMGAIGVKTGNKGDVRRNCRFPNRPSK